MERVYDFSGEETAAYHYHHNGCCIRLFKTDSRTRFDLTIEDMAGQVWSNWVETTTFADIPQVCFYLYDCFLESICAWKNTEAMTNGLVVH